MTVFTKTGLAEYLRKAQLAQLAQQDTTKILDVHENEMNENENDLGGGGIQEKEVETQFSKKNKSMTFSFVAAIAVMVGLAGLMCGLEVYRHSMRANTMSPLLRYQGYCHIPLREREQVIEPYYRMRPLDWHSTAAAVAEAQRFDPTESDSDEDSLTDDDRKSLMEEFSISDNFEKILVFNGPNGRPTSFIHDFAANKSGIIDSHRCFIMALDPEQVLPPRALIMNIEGNAPFDLTRITNTMRAVLPPMMAMMINSELIADKCFNKPTYQLTHDDSIIRKRSTDPAKIEYKYFSGKQVQEIEIGNLNDLIAYEEKANK